MVSSHGIEIFRLSFEQQLGKKLGVVPILSYFILFSYIQHDSTIHFCGIILSHSEMNGRSCRVQTYRCLSPPKIEDAHLNTLFFRPRKTWKSLKTFPSSVRICWLDPAASTVLLCTGTRTLQPFDFRRRNPKLPRFDLVSWLVLAIT